VPFTVRFTENVTDVDSADFELVLSSGVTVSNAIQVSGTGNVYTVDISGISKTDGTLGIRLKNTASIKDSFGNSLTATAPLSENQSYSIDNTAPTVVSILSDKSRLGITNKATITITFSEAPKGFDSFDLGATGGTLSNLLVSADPKVYTATFTPSGITTNDARVTVYAGFSDAAGNAGTGAVMVNSIAIVATPIGKIVPQISTAEVIPLGSISLLIAFTEDVNALALDNFTITGTVTLSNLQRVANSNREFTVVATAGAFEGEFSVGLSANATEDSGLSDNKTAAIAPLTIRVDASSSFSNAKLLTISSLGITSTSGFADSTTDADFFKFVASTDGSISAITKADGSKFDAFSSAFVLDGSNYKLLISNDNNGGGTSSKLDFNVSSGKTYFIKVEAAQKTKGTGKYILDITPGAKLADDFGDTAIDASSILVGSSSLTTNGTLENNQDTDSFKFTANQAGTVSLAFAKGTTTSALATGKLAIFASATATTPVSTLALDTATTFDVEAGKTYYLFVSSDAGAIGDYSFAISFKATLTFTAGVAKASSTIVAAGTTDVYTFTATNTGLLSFLVENKDRTAISQPNFSISTTDGSTVGTNVGLTYGPNGSSRQIITVPVTAGTTYLLKVGETGSFSGSYTVSAQADDFGSNSSSTATPIVNGSIAGRIEVAGDADLFSYSYTNSTANTSKLQILMNAAPGSALLTGMSFSTDNGLTWEPAASKGSLVELDVDAGTTTNLLIWASGASGSSGSTGAYSVNTRVVTDDIGNNPANARIVLLAEDNISTTTGTLNYSGDVDVFKVTLNTSGTTLFSIESSDDAKFDPKLIISSLSGQVIASDDNSGRGLGSLIVLDGTVGDTFYLTVYGSLNDTTGNGISYTLKTGSLPIDDAPNKADSTALPLVFDPAVVVNGKSTQVARLNKTIQEIMPGIADADVYKFIAPDTGRFEVTVTPTGNLALEPTLAPNLVVLAADGKTVLYSSSAGVGKPSFSIPYINKGDLVYISVTGSSNTQGDYSLKVETPVSVVDFYANAWNTGTTALPLGIITLNTGVNSGALNGPNLNIEAARDFDVFSFVANRTGPVKAVVSKTTNSTIDTSISILDASGSVIASNNDADRSTTNSAAVFEVKIGQTYFISVTGNNSTTGQYGIVLEDLTPSDSDGFGNIATTTFGTSNTLVLNANLEASINDSIVSAGDRDAFKITVESDGILSFSLEDRANSNLDSYLRVYNSNKELIAEDNDSGTGLNSLVSVNAIAGDTFYIQAAAVGTSFGTYTLKAKLEVDDYTNLIGPTATAMTVDENFALISGTINYISDDDVFSYTATYSGTIDVIAAADEGSLVDTYLFAYDSTGQKLIDYNNNISPTNTDSHISIQVVKGETYYFKISGAKGTIGDYYLSIAPVADDVGNSIADASNLALTTVTNTTPINTNLATVNGSIEVKGDVDYYQISISHSGVYQFNVSATTINGLADTTLALYSADGQLLGKNDDSSLTTSNSSLSLNLAEGEIVYLKAAGYGENTGNYTVDVIFIGALVIDDFGSTTDEAYAFLFDDNISYSITGASIASGDSDYFKGVADISGNINVTLAASGSTLQGSVTVYVNRNGDILQVGSAKAETAGGTVSLSFSVNASEEFFIQAAGANETSGAYDLTITNTITNTISTKAVDNSIINSTADELINSFTNAIADAAEGTNINTTSQAITDLLVANFIKSMGGTLDQGYVIIWMDPVDFSLTGPGGTIGTQGGSNTNQNSSASLVTNGALNMVVIPTAQASQYNLQLTGVGSGQVLAGVTMVSANGTVTNPTVTGGNSSGGIASGIVPKSGLTMALDFGGSGGGSGGGGSGGGGSGGGGTQVGVLPGNGGSSDSSSSTASSTSVSGSASASGRGSFVSLVNALTQTSSRITGTEATSLIANLASLAFGGGGTATLVNEKQLTKDLGGDPTGDGLELNEKDSKDAKIPASYDVVRSAASFVMVSFAEAYKGTDLAVLNTMDAEKQVVSEIANILDKVLPILVPTEFENSVENILVQTEKTVLQEGKETLAKVANTLTDLVQARLSKNIPAVQPAKNKADAKINTFELVATSLVQENKDGNSAEASDALSEILFAQELPDGFEEMLNFTSVNRNTIDDPLSNSPIVVDQQTNKVAEVAGLLAGALLAPGFLNGTAGKPTPAIEKPKPRKRNS